MSTTEIKTRVAKHLLGDNRYFGHSTLHELLGHETATGLVGMAVTGRRCTHEERDLLDDLAVVMTSADPHIWPLKLARIVASYGGALAGYTASMLPMEGQKQIGPWTIGHAAQTLLDLEGFVETSGGNLNAETVHSFIEATPRIRGYGVPLRDSDERLDALNVRMRNSGREALKYWKLHLALADGMWAKKQLRPNITSGFGAMLLDMGYTPEQASAITTFQNQNVFAANALEGARQQVDALRTLPDDCIEYVGKPERTSPRARAKAQEALHLPTSLQAEA
ncbi:MAG: hypothetical protein ACRELY_26220 [Polyangiaceae bacterium]